MCSDLDTDGHGKAVIFCVPKSLPKCGVNNFVMATIKHVSNWQATYLVSKNVNNFADYRPHDMNICRYIRVRFAAVMVWWNKTSVPKYGVSNTLQCLDVRTWKHNILRGARWFLVYWGQKYFPCNFRLQLLLINISSYNTANIHTGCCVPFYLFYLTSAPGPVLEGIKVVY